MKTKVVLIYLLVALWVNPIMATPDTLLIKSLNYENSSGEQGRTDFYYSELNKNYKARWYLLDESRYSVNYHFLDLEGKLIRKYREFSDSITSNNFYKYDWNGNLIEDYFERSDGVKGIVWYSYENNKKVEAECRGLNGWFFGFIKYKYSGDTLISGLIYKEGKEIGQISYEYDNKGYLIKEYWDFGGKWSQTFTYEYYSPADIKAASYTYSSPFLNETKDFLVQKEEYNWNNEKGGPSIYEYEGNKLVRKIYRYDSLETVTTYEYDRDGLLMKSFRHYNDGRRAEFSYHYNENRQLIHRLFHGNDGFIGSESYHYDADGKLLKAKWNKFDSWLTGTIRFSYDENNRLKTADFKGDDGFDANIDFETDSNQNITKINWNFSFSKTQTYWFEYKEL